MTSAPQKKHPLRFLWWIPAVLILAPLVYLGAALVLGAIPVNRDWRDAPDGVTVWVTTNGVHAGIAMPARHAVMDWTTLFPPVHNAHPNEIGQDVVTVGWGDRHFFLDVPEWGDLTTRTALTAISGTDAAALHVEYGRAPTGMPGTVKLTLGSDAYARLVAAIRRSVVVADDGTAQWIPGHHYDTGDAFYEATGRYSLFVTCNQWTRNALSAAGVRVPVWAPFDKALFWQLRDQPAN
jgi:uncharacterized protein (TIGR02117 family)